jgi:very-short-patch-repair endonuclease
MADYSFFLAYLESHGISAPHPEFRFVPGRKFRADYAWPDERLLLEIDGGIYGGKGGHSSISGILRDMEKGNLASVHGYRVLRFTPDQLYEDRTLEMIRQCLISSGYSPSSSA